MLLHELDSGLVGPRIVALDRPLECRSRRRGEVGVPGLELESRRLSATFDRLLGYGTPLLLGSSHHAPDRRRDAFREAGSLLAPATLPILAARDIRV